MKSIWPAVVVASLLGACGGPSNPDAGDAGNPGDGGDGAPTVADRSATTAEDTPVVIEIGASNPSGGALTVVPGGASHGTVSAQGESLTYAPAADFHGTDAFTVTVGNGRREASATISITVTPVNDAPVAADDAFTAIEDTAAELAATALLGNDTDVDADALTVTAVGSPTHGTVSLSAGTVTFLPAAEYAGPASFTYTVSDGAADDVGTVELTIGSENDAPVAVADAFNVDEDAVLELAFADLVGNDVDAESQALVVTAVDEADVGTVTLEGTLVTYTPPADFEGTATFEYTVSDGVAEAAGLVTVTVLAVNDAPVVTAGTVEAAEDTPLPILLAGGDVDGDALTFAIATPPTRGTLGLVTSTGLDTATVTYTPAADANGQDSFTIVASDGTLASAPATFTITIAPRNDAPAALPQTVTVDEDGTVVVTLVGTDVDGDTLAAAIADAPAHGSLGPVTQASPTTFNVTYTPVANAVGADAFSFTINDGTITSAAALVTLAITPINDAPIAVAATLTTSEDTAVTVTLAGTDIEGDTLTAAVVTGPAHGTLGALTRTSPTAFTATYTPDADFAGSDALTFRMNDGSGNSAPVAVTLTVTAVNDAPSAFPGSANLNEDGPALTLMSGSDPEGSALTFAIGTPPAHGTLGAITNQSPTVATVRYTPDANYFGPDSYTFTVADASGAISARATNNITVVPVADPPVATAGSATTAQNTPVVLTLRGTDVDGDTLAFALVTGPARGTLGAITQASPATATVTYTPAAGSSVDASFTFRVSDGTTNSAPVTFTIVVTGPTVCGDLFREDAETCDDGNASDDDGCSATCTVENGWACSGAPSTCAAICGDGVVAGPETCDDGNVSNNDGCTSLCRAGPVCTSTSIPGGSRYAADPATGICYVAFDNTTATWAAAQATCESAGGFLATIGSASEQAVVAALQNTAQAPWIGASDARAEGTFEWVTLGRRTLGYTNFQSGQPDHAGTAPHALQLATGAFAGQWMDVPATTSGAFGRICEFERLRCGDGVLQASRAEECDDGNLVSNDGCTSTCTAEIFISEYMEGSTDTGLALQNDAIEFYNPSPSKVVLPGTCVIQIWRDATSNFGQSSLSLQAKTIEPFGTLTFCNNQGTPALLARCPDNNVGDGVRNKSMFFNGLQHTSGGNDVFVLRCNVVNGSVDTTGHIYDVVGALGANPGVGGWGSGQVTTNNHTLRRKCGPVVRKTDPYASFDPTGSWNSFPADTVDDIGNYSCP